MPTNKILIVGIAFCPLYKLIQEKTRNTVIANEVKQSFDYFFTKKITSSLRSS